MKFTDKVNLTFANRDCLKKGFHAIKKTDRKYIKARDSRKVEGSVYIEGCVEGGKWDYVVGYAQKAYFIEVHSATSPREIEVVIKKARWLKEWKARTPFRDDNRLYWVAPGRVGFSRNSVQFLRLIKEGISFKGSRMVLS